MRTLPAMEALVLCFGPCAVTWAEPNPALDALQKRAAVLKPAPGESRWREIPWLTDLFEAQRVAREERRPIFLFASAYDPLARC